MSEAKTQLATFRVEPELWEAFKAQARRNGKSASDALTEFVQGYVSTGDVSPAPVTQLDDIEARLAEKVVEAIVPIRQELTELRTKLEHLANQQQVSLGELVA